MLINLRNALMAGKRLPYDAEVEYLESTGTQYIDTGVSGAEQNLIITAGVRINTFSAYLGGFGNYVSGSANCYRLILTNVNNGQAYANCGYTTNSSHVIRNFSLENWHTVILNGAEDRCFCDGVEYTKPTRYIQGTANANTIKLFTSGVVASGTWSKQISAFKVELNGVLVRDYIPVRVGTVGYMYDRVSGKLFGNAGSGDFVVGQDVVPVEWLSSDGNQYIDTGYVFQFGDDVSATFQPLATPTQTAYFLGADTAYNAGFNVHYDPSNSSTGLRYCYGGGFDSLNTGIFISPMQDFSTSTIYACNGNANKRTINSGENTASVQDSGLNSASVILFCGRRNANVRPASTGWAVASRFFGFGATRNGAGVRAMKPVRVGSGSTWEGAMMDVLTRRIYRNAGTGAFTYGNDLKYPIPAS